MSITRQMLKGMGLNQDQEDTIIEAHAETVDALKAERDKYKADAEALPGVRDELKKAQAALDSSDKEDYKSKYENLQEEFDTYKSEQSEKEAHAAKETAFKALLEEAGISEKRIPAVMRVSDIDGVELTKDGKVKNADKALDGIKEEWSDFITTTEEKGRETPNPPANNGGTAMTKDDIVKIKDPVKRQNAIAENIELFEGKGE